MLSLQHMEGPRHIPCPEIYQRTRHGPVLQQQLQPVSLPDLRLPVLRELLLKGLRTCLLYTSAQDRPDRKNAETNVPGNYPDDLFLCTPCYQQRRLSKHSRFIRQQPDDRPGKGQILLPARSKGRSGDVYKRQLLLLPLFLTFIRKPAFAVLPPKLGCVREITLWRPIPSCWRAPQISHGSSQPAKAVSMSLIHI